MPTDAYLELLFSRAKTLLGDELLLLKDIHLCKPLAVAKNQKAELILTLKKSSTGIHFLISSKSPDKAPNEILNVKGKIEPFTEQRPHNYNYIDLISDYQKRFDHDQVYHNENGIDFLGPFYQGIREIKIKDKTATSALELTAKARQWRECFLIHPGIVDGLVGTAMQFTSYLFGDPYSLFIPVGIKKVFIYTTIKEDNYNSFVIATEKNKDNIIFDLDLIDEQSKIVLSLKGLKIQKAPLEKINTQDKEEPTDKTAQLKNAQKSVTLSEDESIAIIGIAGRFPKADNPETLWDNLAQGVDAVSVIPGQRWDINQYYDEDAQKPGKTYAREGAFLNDVDKFDPSFFNIAPAEAEIMDPQQRIFLEECWKALEDAGYTINDLSEKKVGVFVGATVSDYGEKLSHVGEESSAYAFMGLSPAILASRIAYILNLRGPAISIDTACSSSLVAVHQARQSILKGECEIALAGGITLNLSPRIYAQTSRAGMLSRKGRSRPFDQDADGIGLGEAVGVIVLKRGQSAVDDNDYCYGMIMGSGTNQDGASNGITAPNGVAQKALLEEVYAQANINPESITLVEAHGTGTPLGDPIEVNALTNTFREYTEKKTFCALGSVKANVGHTSLAAGITSVIKVLLAMKYKKIPPLIHYKHANKYLNLESSPFYINQDLREWDIKTGQKRRAAVSSFSFSGTNAHVVLEEFKIQKPEVRNDNTKKPYYLIALSAKTEEALNKKVGELSQWIERKQRDETQKTEADLESVSYTLNRKRFHFNKRCCIVTHSIEDLKQTLYQIRQGNKSDNYLIGEDTKDRPEEQAIYNKVLDGLNQELQSIGYHQTKQYYDNLLALAGLYY